MSDDLITSLKDVFDQYKKLIAFIIFVVGFGLRLFSLTQENEPWKFLGEVGTFFAASIAIPFMYDLFIKSVDRKIFLHDMTEIQETILSNKLVSEREYIIESVEQLLKSNYLLFNDKPKFHETGRISLEKKIGIYQNC